MPYNLIHSRINYTLYICYLNKISSKLLNKNKPNHISKSVPYNIIIIIVFLFIYLNTSLKILSSWALSIISMLKYKYAPTYHTNHNSS